MRVLEDIKNSRENGETPFSTYLPYRSYVAIENLRCPSFSGPLAPVVNYWANDIARDEMLEPVVINLDSDDDNSLTNTASDNDDEMFLVLY